MQERYLGDSHDFVKYALLRHLHSETDMRIGVNWYLTNPEKVDDKNNNDGEKRHHLNGGAWQDWDKDLFSRIHKFEDPSVRRISMVGEFGLLPSNTLYFDPTVPIELRREWHHLGLSQLSKSDLVFLDPDNGFEVPSMKRSKTPKYALYSEASDYLQSGKVVLGIQFARQCNPIQKGFIVREQLLNVSGSQEMLPIIRARVAPNILFVAISPSDKVSQITKAFESFAAGSPKMKSSGKRVELIS